MDYCLPHAVLALLQEEDSPQTPKSYFVRSGTHSTKITLVYTRRKRREKSINPSPLTCFSSFSSPSSLSTQTTKTVYGKASAIEASSDFLQLQSSSTVNKLQHLQRSISVTEGCQASVNQLQSRMHPKDKRSSICPSLGGKIGRSSFLASRSQHGSTGTGNGMTSSSSTDDYSSVGNHRRRQQPQDIARNNMGTINKHHNDRKRNLNDGQQSNAKDGIEVNETEGRVLTGPDLNNSESSNCHRKTPPPDHDSFLTNSLGSARRARSDSHNSRRTCVSTPGRGYGDSARVRGAEDPRTRGFSRAVANTDPRRNSVSPRTCENFRSFDHSIDELHDHHEHLTISHNSTPRSDRSSHDHPNHSRQQQEDNHFRLNPCHRSGNTSPRHAIRNNYAALQQAEGDYRCPWLPRSPKSNFNKDQRVSPGVTPANTDSSEADNKCETNRMESTRSPRPPTPGGNNCTLHHNDNLYGPSPVPFFSPNRRPSPAPYHSPSRQSTVEYDDNEAHLNSNFSAPPTPCLYGCVTNEDPVENFNSNVKLRLGAHIDQLNNKVSKASTPKPRRPNDAPTPTPPSIGLRPPSPVHHATEVGRSPAELRCSTHSWRSSK